MEVSTNGLDLRVRVCICSPVRDDFQIQATDAIASKRFSK